MKSTLFIGILLILIGGVATIVLTQNKVQPENLSTDTEATNTQNISEKATEKLPGEKDAVVPIPQSSSIDLSNQNLTKVPSDIFEKRNAEKLDLSHNNLTGALQAEVRHLSALRILDLSDNAFTGVPAEVGQLTKLETLDLSNNKLTGLPYELGNLKNLKVLDLRGNDYAKADLEVIKKNLPVTTQILID